MNRRDDLRVVVMSASLTESGNFKEYFNITDESAILKIPGKLFNVEILVFFWILI